MSVEKPTIDVPESGPFLVKNLKKLTDSQDQPIEMAKDVIALCRCGASKNKPFCDGTHSDIGFTGAKERQETYGAKTFEGKELTVIDNVGVCCHAGACVHGAPSTFFRWDGDERISEPDNEEKQKIVDTIRQCPSGSLAYMLQGELQDEFFSEPEVFVSKRRTASCPRGRRAERRRQSGVHEPLHALPLWGIQEQAVLRWSPQGIRIQRLGCFRFRLGGGHEPKISDIDSRRGDRLRLDGLSSGRP